MVFALLSRKAPFDKADKKTNILYKLLAEKNYMKFWQVQENELVKMGVTQKYSEEFKDLIQKMLAYEPTERLTIEGIKSHAWYNGEVAPLICLVSELEDKLKVVQETHEAKELEKQKVKDLKRQIKALSQASNQTGGLGNFVGYRPFRSGGDETVNKLSLLELILIILIQGEQEKVNKEAEGAIDFSLKRKFASFNLETLPKARTQIFITSDVKSVFVSLYLACKQELNDFSVSKSNYKVTGVQ